MPGEQLYLITGLCKTDPVLRKYRLLLIGISFTLIIRGLIDELPLLTGADVRVSVCTVKRIASRKSSFSVGGCDLLPWAVCNTVLT